MVLKLCKFSINDLSKRGWVQKLGVTELITGEIDTENRQPTTTGD
jgi:hypothetical protein